MYIKNRTNTWKTPRIQKVDTDKFDMILRLSLGHLRVIFLGVIAGRGGVESWVEELVSLFMSRINNINARAHWSTDKHIFLQRCTH